MSEFVSNVLRHQYWFDTNMIDTKNLTIVLRFEKEKDAAHFELALRREIDPILANPEHMRDLAFGRFEIAGIKFKIESPMHR